MGMLNELGVGRFNRLLQKLLEIKGGPPAPTLSTDITPTLELGRPSPEWRYLMGERLGVGFGNVASGAGTSGYVQLASPVTTGVQIVVEAAFLQSTGSTAAQVQLHLNSSVSTAAIVAGSTLARDARLATTGSTNVMVAQVRQGSSVAADIAAIGNAALRCHFAVNGVGLFLPLELVMAPGAAFAHTFQELTQVATASIAVTWFFRERGQEASEA